MKNSKAKKTNHLTPALSPSGEGEATAPGGFKLLPLAAVRPDPDQPRKSFDEDKLQELAQSVAQQGILQPLVVRAVPARFKIEEPELHFRDYRLLKRTPDSDSEWTQVDSCDENNITKLRDSWAGNFGGHGTPEDYSDSYQIIFGERRYRAAGIVGLKEVPCIVREQLTDKDKFILQFIENHQRENLNALEEAEAIKSQISNRKLQMPDFSPEDLAAELGMSRASVYERLKLTRLHMPVREALLAGKISTSVAGEVAKLPTPQSQEALLKVITNEEAYGYPYSVRDVQELIDDEYVKQLNDAPFNTKTECGGVFDGQPMVSCAACPFRTGNMVAAFPELASRPNGCTRPDCFAAKCKAHFADAAKAITAKGGLVLTAKEFKKMRADYVPAAQGAYDLFAARNGNSPKEVLGKHAPAPVVVVTEDGLTEFYARTDIEDAAKKAKVKLATVAKPQTKEEQEAEAAEKQKLQELGDRRRAYVESQLPELAKRLPKLKTAEAWKLCAMLVENQDGYWDDEIVPKLVGKSKDPQTRALGRLFADNEMQPIRHYSHEWHDLGVDAWLLAGIDVVAGFEKAEKAAQAALALVTSPGDMTEKQFQKHLDIVAPKSKKKKKGKK